MERELKLTLLICVALAVVGCGGESGSAGVVGTPALDPLDATPRYAVISSDFSSSSIAMLDEDFVVIDESWLNSGTTYPGLVATLSGDVVLPNRQAGDGTFAVIDRFLTDVVTRFFVPSGNLNGQVRTHGDVGDSGFSSNPQDFIFAGEDSAWTPRYESNLNPSAPREHQGTDLIEINPADMSVTGARIDLSSLDTTAIVMTQDGPVEVEVFARPSRGVLVGSLIVVGLDRISANFDAAGPGMVAVVDLEDESVTGLELPGFKSCGNAGPVPGAPSKVVFRNRDTRCGRKWRHDRARVASGRPPERSHRDQLRRCTRRTASRRGCDRRLRDDGRRAVLAGPRNRGASPHPRVGRLLRHRSVGL
ncbi:MAG: hypothetical protein JRF42_14605 [Deltaproteobacteria bacterium]|nr:hypothetical protein [Deltaproteobacteria bacterium]